MELLSDTAAINDGYVLTDATKELGAQVNPEASKDGAEEWDKEESLTAYKYIHIPYKTDEPTLEITPQPDGPATGDSSNFGLYGMGLIMANIVAAGAMWRIRRKED